MLSGYCWGTVHMVLRTPISSTLDSRSVTYCSVSPCSGGAEYVSIHRALTHCPNVAGVFNSRPQCQSTIKSPVLHSCQQRTRSATRGGDRRARCIPNSLTVPSVSQTRQMSVRQQIGDIDELGFWGWSAGFQGWRIEH